MKVLVVDDLSFMRSLIKDILVSGGHEIAAEAADGREALILRRAFKPDVTLLDIAMPRMDGRDGQEVDPVEIQRMLEQMMKDMEQK